MTEALMTQSTNHLFMIEPAVFYANPETMPTNAYQIDGHEHHDAVFQRALSELRGFRDNLVAHGVMVTTAKGFQECPDMVFPNWASTHAGGQMILYPMLNANRQAERDPAIIKALSKAYPEVIDWTGYEKDGLCLEARSSIVSDRVNKRGVLRRFYGSRTDEDLVVCIGRPVDEIRGEARRMCLSKDKGFLAHAPQVADRAVMPRWTSEEIRVLRERYARSANLELARLLSRSVASIANKANQLGLKKAQDVLQEMGRQNVAGRWAGS